MVISVETLSGKDPAAYYLERDVGCEAGYYLHPTEPTGRWIGDGATALGLSGPLDDAGEAAFRRMLAGQHPLTGEQLAGPVWRPVPAGRLPGAPLVSAIRQLARDRGVTEPTALFTDEKLADAFRGVASAADRRPFTRSLDPRIGQRLANAVGLDPIELYRGDDGADKAKRPGTSRSRADGSRTTFSSPPRTSKKRPPSSRSTTTGMTCSQRLTSWRSGSSCLVNRASRRHTCRSVTRSTRTRSAVNQHAR